MKRLLSSRKLGYPKKLKTNLNDTADKSWSIPACQSNSLPTGTPANFSKTIPSSQKKRIDWIFIRCTYGQCAVFVETEFVKQLEENEKCSKNTSGRHFARIGRGMRPIMSKTSEGIDISLIV